MQQNVNVTSEKSNAWNMDIPYHYILYCTHTVQLIHVCFVLFYECIIVCLQDCVAVRNSRNAGLPTCSEIFPDFEPGFELNMDELRALPILPAGAVISPLPRHFQWATKKIPLSLLGLGSTSTSSLATCRA
jgi:hypothetical protein